MLFGLFNILEWVSRDVVIADLEVEVRASRRAAAADMPNDIACVDDLPRRYVDALLKMCI